MKNLDVSFVELPHGAGLPAPGYATANSAGVDLHAAIEEDSPLTLKPGDRAAIPTGLQLAIPSGFEGQVRSRSGLALNNAITVLNSPGTIDADYRGEVKVILVNLGVEDFKIIRGMRIAQLVFAPVVQAKLQRAQSLDATARGDGGFGSTGTERELKIG